MTKLINGPEKWREVLFRRPGGFSSFYEPTEWHLLNHKTRRGDRRLPVTVNDSRIQERYRQAVEAAALEKQLREMGLSSEGPPEFHFHVTEHSLRHGAPMTSRAVGIYWGR